MFLLFFISFFGFAYNFAMQVNPETLLEGTKEIQRRREILRKNKQMLVTEKCNDFHLETIAELVDFVMKQESELKSTEQAFEEYRALARHSNITIPGFESD